MQTYSKFNTYFFGLFTVSLLCINTAIADFMKCTPTVKQSTCNVGFGWTYSNRPKVVHLTNFGQPNSNGVKSDDYGNIIEIMGPAWSIKNRLGTNLWIFNGTTREGYKVDSLEATCEPSTDDSLFNYNRALDDHELNADSSEDENADHEELIHNNSPMDMNLKTPS